MGDQLSPLNWLGFAVCLLGISLHVSLKALGGKEGGAGEGQGTLFLWALEGQLTPPSPRRAKGHKTPRGAWLGCRPGAFAAAGFPGGGAGGGGRECPPALSHPLGAAGGGENGLLAGAESLGKGEAGQQGCFWPSPSLWSASCPRLAGPEAEGQALWRPPALSTPYYLAPQQCLRMARAAAWKGGLGTCQESLCRRYFDGSEVPQKRAASLSLR